MKILTVSRAGLVRSVALADVLKSHYGDTDVLSAGIDFNKQATKEMLYRWADIIIIMEKHYLDKIEEEYRSKTFICEVGPDTYVSPKNPELIEKVWNWVRANSDKLNFVEHNRKI